jgi:hypothetical protein
MIGLLIAGVVGVGVVYAVAGSSSSASSGNAATSAQQTALYNSAQAFDTAAQGLGLTAAQAQQAYNAGVSASNLASYAQQQGWSNNQSTTPSATSTGGPARLIDRGEWNDELGKVYRCSESGAPVVLDSKGNPFVVYE